MVQWRVEMMNAQCSAEERTLSMAERRSNYAEKLRDPRWQKLRLQVMERDEWMCEICYDHEPR